MKNINVGIIGYGFFGEMHTQVVQSIEGVTLCAIADPRGVAFPVDGADVMTDYKDLLNRSDIDAVHICVPDKQHTEMIEAAVDADKHIFVEKPLTEDTASAQSIYQKVRNYKKKLMVGYILRFNPSSVSAYEQIRRGDIGDIVYVSSRRVSPISGGLKYGKNSNLAIHSCVHDIDLARWLVGSEYSSVVSKARTKALKDCGVDTYDVILSMYEFKNGVIYAQENSWVLSEQYPVYVDGSMHILGDKGSVHLDFFSNGLQVYTRDGMYYPDLIHWPYVLGERRGDLRTEIEHFYHAVAYDHPVRVGVYDGLVATQMADAVLDSIQSNKQIVI